MLVQFALNKDQGVNGNHFSPKPAHGSTEVAICGQHHVLYDKLAMGSLPGIGVLNRTLSIRKANDLDI